MRAAGWWGSLILVVIAITCLAPHGQAEGAAPARPAMQSSSLNLVMPAGCPAGGCAAGQRFNLSFDFALQSYDPSASPNVKLCFYAPSGWNVVVDATDPVQGQLTGDDYQRVDNCAEDAAPPDGYTMILARQASITVSTFSDMVGVGLRFATNASGEGRFMARLFESSDGVNFNRTQQATTPILSVAAAAANVYVANDAVTCGNYTPCFQNSADDQPTGVGTGLYDAVQAVTDGATITVLGNYTVKSNPVVIDKAVTLTGINDARITYTGNGPCSEVMLSLQDAITLRGLNITDGVCTAPNRSLVEVNSSADVLIESNDLTGGDNAIFIVDNSGNVRVRFNHISENGGYAVYSAGHTRGGALEVTANNLNNNKALNLIECSAASTGVIANRRANHNYWGPSAPSQELTHCTLVPGKRLGAPVTLRTGTPGINAQLVTVKESKTYAFADQIAFRRTGGSDFNLFIVDHGYVSETGAPFTTAAGLESPNPCSNYWDVFLPDGVNPDSALVLAVKYNKTSACLAAVNSNLYCGQTLAANFPLYWYDPATGATDGWDTTGQRPAKLTNVDGQVTTCNMNDSEIQVEIDNSGRPALGPDLSYTPLMAAIPILRTFLPLASSQVINVTWTTYVEPDVQGFYVLRGLDAANLAPISDLIPRRGSATMGVSTPAYSFLDTGRVNGVTYYYRLQIVRSDGRSIYSKVEAITANIATITPTPTISPTFTIPPPFPTFTPRPTLIPTQRPTPLPTWTATPQTATATITPFTLQTSTASPTVLATASETITTIPTSLTATSLPTATGATPPVVAEGNAGQAPWLSLFLGILSGLAVVAAIGLGWYFWWKS